MRVTKKEIKKAKNNELITDAIRTYWLWGANEMSQRGTKQLCAHFQDLCAELVERGLITQEDWDNFNK